MNIRLINTDKPTGMVGVLPMENGNEGGGGGNNISQNSGSEELQQNLAGEVPAVAELGQEDVLSDEDKLMIAKDINNSGKDRFEAAESICDPDKKQEAFWNIATNFKIEANSFNFYPLDAAKRLNSVDNKRNGALKGIALHPEVSGFYRYLTAKEMTTPQPEDLNNLRTIDKNETLSTVAVELMKEGKIREQIVEVVRLITDPTKKNETLLNIAKEWVNEGINYDLDLFNKLYNLALSDEDKIAFFYALMDSGISDSNINFDASGDDGESNTDDQEQSINLYKNFLYAVVDNKIAEIARLENWSTEETESQKNKFKQDISNGQSRRFKQAKVAT